MMESCWKDDGKLAEAPRRRCAEEAAPNPEVLGLYVRVWSAFALTERKQPLTGTSFTIRTVCAKGFDTVDLPFFSGTEGSDAQMIGYRLRPGWPGPRPSAAPDF